MCDKKGFKNEMSSKKEVITSICKKCKKIIKKRDLEVQTDFYGFNIWRYSKSWWCWW